MKCYAKSSENLIVQLANLPPKPPFLSKSFHLFSCTGKTHYLCISSAKNKEQNKTFLPFNFQNIGRQLVQYAASVIAELYHNRWNIELFFKWLKQHLKIKKFWGTSENAVRIQIYCAVITYCLIICVKHNMKLERSVYEILQIVGISLTDKTNLKELFDKSNINNVNERCDSSKPSLFNF